MASFHAVCDGNTLWKEIYGEENILMVEKYPEIRQEPQYDGDEVIQRGVELLMAINFVKNKFFKIQNIITKIRILRTEYKIEPAKKLRAIVNTSETELIEQNKAIFLRLANLEDIEINGKKPGGAISFVESGVEVHLDLASAVDTEKEKARIEKEIANVEPYVKSLTAKLAGDFAKNAPEKIVEGEKQKLADAEEKLRKLQEQLSSL
jgi:valyl-tRNA synthetase